MDYFIFNSHTFSESRMSANGSNAKSFSDNFATDRRFGTLDHSITSSQSLFPMTKANSSSQEPFPENQHFPNTPTVPNERHTALLSNETINGRSSPEIWPETVLNLSKFYSKNRASIRVPATVATGGVSGKVNFEKGDITILSEYSTLSTQGILSKLDELENIAYELGVQELHEINRGKFLNIFDNTGN